MNTYFNNKFQKDLYRYMGSTERSTLKILLNRSKKIIATFGYLRMKRFLQNADTNLQSFKRYM